MASGTEQPLDAAHDNGTQAPVSLPHLQRDLALIQRYAGIYSNTSFTSSAPLVGPVIVALKDAARGLLRRAASAGLGTQAEFNAAVADILFEFTRRATTATPLALHDSALEEALTRAADASFSEDNHTVITLLARDLQLLHEQVRAAQFTASENERAIAELRRELAYISRLVKEKEPARPA